MDKVYKSKILFQFNENEFKKEYNSEKIFNDLYSELLGDEKHPIELDKITIYQADYSNIIQKVMKFIKRKIKSFHFQIIFVYFFKIQM